jgi:hypothetical protein
VNKNGERAKKEVRKGEIEVRKGRLRRENVEDRKVKGGGRER